MEVSRPQSWSGQPFPSAGDLPDPGMKRCGRALGRLSRPGSPPSGGAAGCGSLSFSEEAPRCPPQWPHQLTLPPAAEGTLFSTSVIRRIFFFGHMARGISVVPPPGMEPTAPALEAWGLTRRAARRARYPQTLNEGHASHREAAPRCKFGSLW